MAETGDRDVNLSALQRVDPYIVEVLNSATQVALYKFSSREDEWDKTGVEGSLFIYRRSAPPFYGFLIMNRLSKTNQVEPITKELELKMECPYLLYRNFNMNIFGIWFYEQNDCGQINDTINRLLNLENENSENHPRLRRASESDTGINLIAGEKGHNIFSMLSKAQEVYLKNNGSEPKPIAESPKAGAVAAASADVVRPRAVRINSNGAPDVTRTTPNNTLAFQLGNIVQKEKQLTVEDLFAAAVSKHLASTPVKAPPQTKDPPPHNQILQRLMSNPENLVEHIEKRQRNENLPLTNVNEEKGLPCPRFSTSSSTESCTSPKLHSDSLFTPAMFENACVNTPDQSSSHLTPSRGPVPPPASLHMSLMSPSMFNTPSSFTREKRLAPPSFEQDESEVEPLTKAQLVQAMTHLLKTDSQFVNKLHEAYVKTLQSKSNCNRNGLESHSNSLF